MGGPGSGRRKTIGPRLTQVVTLPPCGTAAMYQRHRKKGEDCSICRHAYSKVCQERKIKVGLTQKKSSVNTSFKMRQMIKDEKLARLFCLDCSIPITLDNTFMFDFDHRDPAEKLFTISRHYKGVSYASLINEMNKCDLVCANCHRHRTQKQFRAKILTGFATRPTVKQPTLFDYEVICLPYS